jgi:hypothetical protein
MIAMTSIPARHSAPPSPPDELLTLVADYEDMLEAAEAAGLEPQTGYALKAWYSGRLNLADSVAVALWRQEVESGMNELDALLNAGED